MRNGEVGGGHGRGYLWRQVVGKSGKKVSRVWGAQDRDVRFIADGEAEEKAPIRSRQDKANGMHRRGHSRRHKKEA